MLRKILSLCLCLFCFGNILENIEEVNKIAFKFDANGIIHLWDKSASAWTYGVTISSGKVIHNKKMYNYYIKTPNSWVEGSKNILIEFWTINPTSLNSWEDIVEFFELDMKMKYNVSEMPVVLGDINQSLESQYGGLNLVKTGEFSAKGHKYQYHIKTVKNWTPGKDSLIIERWQLN